MSEQNDEEIAPEDWDAVSRPFIRRSELGYDRKGQKRPMEGARFNPTYAPDDDDVLNKLFGIETDDWSSMNR